jgi:microcystin-dependent protein
VAFDFPASPTEGQIFQPPGGPIYVYKAPTWNIVTTVMTPPGTIITVAMSTAPVGFLKANGALISRVTYATLFAAIGTTFGVGDGSTTFAIPDLRGEFPRYWDDARGVDVGRAFGSAQADGVKSHTHAYSATSGNSSSLHTHAVSGSTGGRSASHTHAIGGTTGGDSVSHTHSFSDASSATGTVSATHTHTVGIYGGTGADTNLAGKSGDAILSGNQTSGSISANHTHNVAVSGTSGGRSASHTHSFSDTSSNETTEHVHSFADSASTTDSVHHQHTTGGTTDANGAATTENRPRNIALLACIKY